MYMYVEIWSQYLSLSESSSEPKLSVVRSHSLNSKLSHVVVYSYIHIAWFHVSNDGNNKIIDKLNQVTQHLYIASQLCL